MLPPRYPFLSETYSPEGMNLGLGHCCIGTSDHSRNVHSYDGVSGDMNLDHLNLRHDEVTLCLLCVSSVKSIRLFLLGGP
jgi:Glycosyl hydrolase family 30 TIM-barrel domain